jgi:hypothetical protein
MRYAGERDTLDMVGLTTPGAAAAWRNGPGSVAEFLMQQQPDYIASYGAGHGYGLYMLEETALYGEPLALFQIEDWQRWKNVSLAADTQGIYQPDWSQIQQETTESVYITPDAEPVLRVDVANLSSEAAAGYTWQSAQNPGFVTEVQQFDDEIGTYRALYEGVESFTVPVNQPDEALLLVTRVHARSAGMLDIYVDDTHIAERWIPAIPGAWFDVPTLISADTLTDNSVTVRVEATVPGGTYMPSVHEIYAVRETSDYMQSLSNITEAIATYQDGAFWLADSDVTVSDDDVRVNLAVATDGSASGDYRMFVHLYDDINAQPVAQVDAYFGGQLPGNWLPGTLHDEFMLNTSGLQPGTYRLAVGFYSANAPHERLIPTGDNNSSDDRVWLNEVEIE